MCRERVLVVDDSSEIRHVLARALERLGYEVGEAGDGLDALDQVARALPAVIITDLRMPRMDGHGLLKRLVALNVHSAVIVISANGTMDDVVSALREGAVDYLKKPFTSVALSSAMARALEAYGKRTHPLDAPHAPVPPAAPPPQEHQEHEVLCEEDQTFDGVLELLRKGEIVIPPVPSVISELREVVAKPETSIDDVAHRIEQDQRLTAEVLRIASSPVYLAGAHQVTSVRGAVNRLGFRSLQNMVETVWSKGVFQASDPALRSLQLRLWRHSVARAMTMRAIAGHVRRSDLDAETAYAAGLLADVGASFLLWLASERARAGKPITEAACLAGIRRQHEALGAALAESWKLDDTVRLAARIHHAETPPQSPSTLWQVAVVATAIADELAPDDDITCDHIVKAEVQDRAISDLRLAPEAIEKMMEALQPELASVVAVLGR